ncbi:MAG: glycerophosphodiester phosphodiesterase family protein [Mycetocola sp.]
MTFPGRARPLIIGHRGAPGYRPEHTRSSYELALALGADAVEPDIVASKDGVLVLRHENEISGTTDVASRPEFAGLRATKVVDGKQLTGWFTEDLTWEELSTLRSKERIPALRSSSASFDGSSGVLRLRDLVDILDSAAETSASPPGIVVEIKHATYFERAGLPLDDLLASELAGTRFADGAGLVIEAFEHTVLRQLAARGLPASYVYLIEKRGRPFDAVAAHGSKAPKYADSLTAVGLDALAAGGIDGISVDKALLFSDDQDGSTNDLVDRAHDRDLAVFTWTLRPENAFLAPAFRSGDEPAEFGNWQAEFDAILKTGVDGAFCDHPDLGVAARDALSG